MSAQQAGPLPDIAEQKTDDHGRNPHNPQASRMHLDKLFELALHGLRRDHIRQSFEYQNQTDQADKCLHGQITYTK